MLRRFAGPTHNNHNALVASITLLKTFFSIRTSLGFIINNKALNA
jgi:hypothetical protein